MAAIKITWLQILACANSRLLDPVFFLFLVQCNCVTQQQKRDDFEHTDSDVPLEDDMLHTWHKLSIHFHPEKEVFISIIKEKKVVKTKITNLISKEVN